MIVTGPQHHRMGEPALLDDRVFRALGQLADRMPAKNSGVTTRLVASSATALAPFSQNSAGRRPPGASGQAQPGQSKPCRWFSRASVAAVRTGPICSSPRLSDTMTALTPAASVLAPLTSMSSSL